MEFAMSKFTRKIFICMAASSCLAVIFGSEHSALGPSFEILGGLIAVHMIAGLFGHKFDQPSV
jgi:hypothetical protein